MLLSRSLNLGLPPLPADSASVATPGSASITVPFAELGYPPSQVSSVHNSATSSVTDAPAISASQFAGGRDVADASLDPYHGIP